MAGLLPLILLPDETHPVTSVDESRSDSVSGEAYK